MEIFSLSQYTEAEYSILMAIVDFIPVALYFIAAWMVTKDLYKKASPTAYAFLSAGALMCFIGGAFKALWKLLFCFGINYPFLYTALFPMQAPGFCLFFAGLIMVMRKTKKTDGKAQNVVAATVTTSLPLIMFQTIGCVGSHICLAVLAIRMKKPAAVVLFVLAVVFILAMGGIGAALDSSLSWVNWFDQGINTASQACMLGGVLILHKNGLAENQ